MLVVHADFNEELSGVPAELEKLGLTVIRTCLPAGDYHCGAGTLVERKSVADLHGSIVSGRFWPQMGRIRDAARSPFLLIEGPDLYKGSIRPDALRGLCFAASDLGIHLIRSIDPGDTAQWLAGLAGRRQRGFVRDRPAYSQRPKRPRGVMPAEAMLASVAGISTRTARSLLEAFGSLRAVLSGDPETWQRVAGVGPQRAAALEDALDRQWEPQRPN